MREIKFRAWDTVEKKMTYFFLKDYGTIRSLIAYTGDFYGKIEIMQFTGLKDKNGREIYEGDILSNGYGKAPVIFEYGKFGLKFDNGYLRAIKSRPDFEVIGNVWENLELLSPTQGRKKEE